MDALLLRLALTPSTVLLAAVVQRRWGHALGGRLIGLPLTTGPFLILVALGHGAAATSVAAAGVVAGQISVVAFCITYAQLSRRLRAGRSLAASWVVCAASVLTLRAVPGPWPQTAVVLAVAVAGLATWPAMGSGHQDRVTPRPWQTPTRAVASGALVAALTAATRVLGPYLAGVLATTPVILSVLAPGTHRSEGPGAVAAMLGGTLAGMPATVLFAAVLSSVIQPLGVTWAFLAALAVLVVATTAIWNVSRTRVLDSIEAPYPAR